MDWFLLSIRGKNNKKMIKLNIFVDTLDNISQKPFTIELDDDSTLGNLCSKVTIKKKLEEDSLYWFINNQFVSNKTKLVEILHITNHNLKIYDIHLIYIKQNEAAKVNDDIEEFLRQRYPNDKNIEIKDEFQLIDIKTKLPIQDNIEYGSNCPVCHTNVKYTEIADLLNCQHVICRKCFTGYIMDFKTNGFKCPQLDCLIIFCDHEIQKILDIENYDKFQELLLQEKDNEQFPFPKIGWMCVACTYLNLPYTKFCLVCNNNRPAEYKIPRYWLPTTEDEEEMKKIHESELEDELRNKAEEENKKIHLEQLRKLSIEPITMTFEETECPVCMMTYEAGQAIILHSCLHTICKDCLRNYLLNIEDAQVKCPTENCIGLLEDKEIRSILTEQEYIRYDGLSMRMAEAKEKQSFHCKEINCTAWVAYDGLVYTFKCPLCKKENCIPCNTIHEGMTCVQYKQAQNSGQYNHSITPADDLFIQKLIDNGEAMKCPGCGILVQKDKGCDGVTCKSCGIMMCWATKGPRWGPKGKGDTSGGCGCQFFWGKRCHPNCHYCH